MPLSPAASAQGTAPCKAESLTISHTVTLSSKAQLTIPRNLRDRLGLTAGSLLQVSVDPQGRLMLVPAHHEPEELFRNRPRVTRVLSLEDMERAIAAAVDRADP